MKKRILSLLTALCLCLSLLPTTAWAGNGENHDDHTDWTPVSSPSEINNTGNYYLTGDVTLENQWKIKSGTTITLCLNGHKLITSNNDSEEEGAENYSILVENGGRLKIADCKDTGTIVNNSEISFAGGEGVNATYAAFIANNPTITGSGYIKVYGKDQYEGSKHYSHSGTLLNGLYNIDWSRDINHKLDGCEWNSNSNTLTLSNVYINFLNLSGINTDLITIVIDGEATINSLTFPNDYTGTITIQGNPDKTENTLYSSTQISLGKGAVTLKDLTATLHKFTADSLVLTDSNLTMDSDSELSANSITMDSSSSITLNNTTISDGLEDLLPDGYSINGDGKIVDSDGKVVTSLTLSAKPTDTPPRQRQ